MGDNQKDLADAKKKIERQHIDYVALQDIYGKTLLQLSKVEKDLSHKDKVIKGLVGALRNTLGQWDKNDWDDHDSLSNEEHADDCLMCSTKQAIKEAEGHEKDNG